MKYRWLSITSDKVQQTGMSLDDSDWFPQNFREQIVSLLEEEKTLSQSDVARGYLQTMLDENFNNIKEYAQAHPSSLSEAERFHGYCDEVSHVSVCCSDGTVPLDWHDMTDQQIPAAWDNLSQLVAFSEYPLNMWRAEA